MKNKIVKDIKKGIKLKIITASLLIFLVPLLLVSIFSLFFLKFNTGDPIEMMKLFEIPEEYLIMAESEAKSNELEFSKLLAYSMGDAGLDEENYTRDTLDKSLSRMQNKARLSRFEKYLYEDILSKVYDDLEAGPIAKATVSYRTDKETGEETAKTIRYEYTSYDDFGVSRTYGGDRKHEGNDLMADIGVPIISITDGEVTNLGWNDYGGWRVGITTNKGTYFYYAHLDEYSPGIEKGKKVKAGDVIGYVGDSGYGPPGTTGRFESHLHLQIGIMLNKKDKEYTWLNPYPIVKFLDQYRVVIEE